MTISKIALLGCLLGACTDGEAPGPTAAELCTSMADAAPPVHLAYAGLLTTCNVGVWPEDADIAPLTGAYLAIAPDGSALAGPALYDPAVGYTGVIAVGDDGACRYVACRIEH